MQPGLSRPGRSRPTTEPRGRRSFVGNTPALIVRAETLRKVLSCEEDYIG